MDSATLAVLLELNRRFYGEHALEFSATRQQPWQGWRHLLQRFEGERAELSILDLGCGNARFASACDRQLVCAWRYHGIDGSKGLIEEARGRLETLGSVGFELKAADLFESKTFPARSRFDLVTLFGVMHHVPGKERREELLSRAAACVAPDGLLAVSFWQLGDSPQLMERTVKPTAVGLEAGALSAQDHLLSWGDGGAVRYCHHCDLEEAAGLVAATTALTSLETYRADGRGGGMNLYWLLASPPAAAAGVGRS